MERILNGNTHFVDQRRSQRFGLHCLRREFRNGRHKTHRAFKRFLRIAVGKTFTFCPTAIFPRLISSIQARTHMGSISATS